MKLDAFLKQLNDDPASVTLDMALSTVGENYEFTPCGYTLGGVRFEADKTRSCQLYAFGLLHKLTRQQTLACFGHHYHDDVLKNPQGTDHQTVRLFMKYGWDGLKLDAMPLKARAAGGPFSMNQQANPTVGFIGLGIMGAAMASNLQKAGYRLVVNDVRREATEFHVKAGALWADTPRALAEQCEMVITCLPGLPQIEAVALGPDGILAGIRPGHAYFEMSTNSPELVKRLHAAFSAKGVHMLDAPISGGARGAQRARLAIYVGGEKSVYERYEPVLKAMGDHPVHVGAVGAGLITKLVHNCASQATQAAIAEVFVLGVKAGAEPLSLWQAIRQGSIGRRRTFDGLIDEFLPARYEPPNAALRIIHKDMMIATGVARELGVPMRFAELALADVQEAMNRGWAERDCRSVMLLPQERAGVRIKVDPADIQQVLREDPPAPSDTKYGTGT
jgi:3-hydroxyisobutyrate dehydrogenase-like beta-hydroxyacid dehydrogenase